VPHSLTRAAAAKLAAAAREADQAMKDHPALMAFCLDTGWSRRAHSDRISQSLRDLKCGQCKRLAIYTPPQVGKSTLGVVWLAFWWLCHNPTDHVVIGSYGKDLATRAGRKIRKLVQKYGARWGLYLERGASSVTDWTLTSGGGVKSVGVGSGVTGSPGDLIIIDDPHKSRADAESLVARDKVASWYSADMMTRRSPGAPVVLIQTRWHTDDLAGRVIKKEGREENGGLWRVLRMPAYADKADDPLGRRLGEPLPHPDVDEGDVDALRAHWEEQRATVSLRDWFAMFMADPQPIAGALVTEELLRLRRHHPMPAEAQKSGVGIDPSGGGRDVAGIIGGHLGDDGRLYFVADRSIAGPSEEWGMEAAILAAELDAEYFVVEQNFGRDMARVVLRSSWNAVQRMANGNAIPTDDPATVARCQGLNVNRLMPEIKLRNVKKAKLLKAEPVAQQWADDRLRTGSYLPEMEQEWCTWQPTNKDSPGRIDASCVLAYEMIPIPGAETVISSPAGVKRNQVVPGSNRPRIRRR
jgi:hypothetical protein